MSGSVNKVILLGNLGRDPEVRAMQNGDKVVQLSVATSDRWKDKSTGEQKERTEWHRVVIFNEPLGKIAEQYLKKGSSIYIEGQLQTRKWTDQQTGQDKFTTEIVLQRYKGELTLLGSRNNDSTNFLEKNEDNQDLDKKNDKTSLDTPLESPEMVDDEIPF